MHTISSILAAFLVLAAPLSHAQEKPAPLTKTAIFAGGCFWCMQEPYDRTPGVVKTVVGYTGGSQSDANYSAVSGHKTQHREAIEVTYDPAVVSYDQLLDVFWGRFRHDCATIDLQSQDALGL